VLPGFGCHWSRLRASVKGEWVDLLKPVGDGDALLDGPTHHGCFLEAPWSRGDVYMRPWSVVDALPARFAASLESVDFEDFNFPHSLRFVQHIELRDDRLEVRTTIENVDQQPAPAGLGFYAHMLRRPTWRDEDLLLHIPAASTFRRERPPATTSQQTDTPHHAEGAAELRDFRPLGERAIDHCYTDFEESQIRIIYPGSRVEIRLELDENFRYATVNTAAPKNGRAKTSTVALRLATHAPDERAASKQGAETSGLRTLQPGETWETTWTLSVGDI
jgi:galactose mutarotase-like enzyme